mgnify:FL=1
MENVADSSADVVTRLEALYKDLDLVNQKVDQLEASNVSLRKRVQDLDNDREMLQQKLTALREIHNRTIDKQKARGR